MKKSMGRNRRATLRRFLWLVLTCNLGCVIALAQNSLDEVHIKPLADSSVTNNLENQSEPLLTADIRPLRKNVDLVLVPVTITDRRERIITGLDQSNFKVFDGKHQQEIKHFSNEDAPVSLGIVLDTSNSMGSKMDWARQAVMEFCRTANPQDEFFLVTFADQPELTAGFTNAPEEIEKNMAFVTTRGRTSLLDAIALALNQMRHAQYQKRALLIISDGGDNHSRYSEAEIKAMVKEADVTIYGIGIYDRGSSIPEELYGPVLLEEITELTGGRAFTIEKLNLLPQVATQIGTELRNQYLLAYRPENQPHNGKWHKINVKLSVPKSLWPLWIHAKQGYYAPGK